MFVVERHEGEDSWETIFGMAQRGQAGDGTFKAREDAEEFSKRHAGSRVREVSEPCLYYTGSERGDARRAFESLRSLASLGLGSSGNAYDERRAMPIYLKSVQRAIDKAYPQDSGKWSDTPPSEPGVYWVRNAGELHLPPFAETMRNRADGQGLFYMDSAGDCPPVERSPHREFWSERIAEPPA